MLRDVVIVGGGPAGLAAALVFGRSRKHVTVFDAGEPRNAASEHVHGYYSRDGIARTELRAVGREQLAEYPTVEVRDARVLSIDGLRVTSESGALEARAILLAAGLVDELPPLPGLAACWGKTVLHCPYCHAYECRDRRFGFLPRTADELEFALLLRGWTDDVIVFANGIAVDDATRRDYERANVRIDERRVTGVRADGNVLRAVEVEGGEVECDDLFVHPTQRQTPLVQSLGLRMFDENSVWIDEHGETSWPRIYAAGDLVTPIHGAILAAAAGTALAYKINTRLTKEMMRENR